MSTITSLVSTAIATFKDLARDPRFRRNFVPIPATSALQVGQFAPKFTLTDVTQECEVRLAAFRDSKPVIVAFTRIFNENLYCPLCYPHIVELRDRYTELTATGAEVLLVTSTDGRQSQQIAADLSLPMPLLSDSSNTVFRRYGTGQALGAPLPAQFVLDREGCIRFKHLFSFLDPNAGVDRLLAALAAMQ
ncbi:peroxiredoxin [Rubidibacter lacunae KORDI 51-2]|uniref:Peroxiredoxin n=1 Tax=Rubidibacter lacunae KORDI 51-2 TaxID=582515 RepID=U5DQH6_9CHRO|nr:redoxin domain-containing protein [Rubidibacter lacunae]ERN42874.1 peroxiredoxin [Rubidibacter lacunae KORDI 51-2]